MIEFANCRFDVKPPEQDSPIGRWGHTSCVLNDQVIFFGGEADQCTEVQGVQPVMILNTNTNKFSQAAIPGGPRARDSHSCVIVRDRLYVWGGCKNKQACNDCYCFFSNTWKLINQKGRIPSPRESQLTGVLNNRYILMYGGCKDSQCYNDFHIFDTEQSTWYVMTRFGGGLTAMPLRQGATMSIVRNSTAYIFGGQNNQDKHCNDMFKVSLQNYTFEKRAPPPVLLIDRVNYRSTIVPMGRSDHSSVVFDNKYIIVIGGSTQLTVEGGKIRQQLLNDIWAFNLTTEEWQRLQPQGHQLFQKRCNFSAVLYEDDIIIFGGMTGVNKNPIHADLVTLSLEPASKRLATGPYKVCGLCQSVFSNPAQQQQQQSSMVITRTTTTFKVSRQAIKSMAMLIGHPFNAFRTIIGYLVARRCQNIKIICFNKNAHRYIRIVSDSIPYDNLEVVQSLARFGLVYDCSTSETANRNMKLACLRLCPSFIIINTLGEEQSVSLITPIEELFYIINLKTGQLINSNETILKQITSLIGPYQFDKDLCTLQIILLEPINELHFSTDDIVLERRGLAMTMSASTKPWEYQLKENIARQFLEPPIIRLTINSKQVELINMKTRMKIDYENEDIRVDCKKMPEAVLVWRPESNDNFIGYYHNNNLIGSYCGRLDNEYSGHVTIPQEIPVNIFATDFQSIFERQSLERHLQMTLQQHNNQHRLKRPPLVSIEDFVVEAQNGPTKRQHLC